MDNVVVVQLLNIEKSTAIPLMICLRMRIASLSGILYLVDISR